MRIPPTALLEALIAISETRSLLRAADQLHLTQPALSMRLKSLEEFFELPLFEFQGKRKILTPYGESICKESKNLLSEFKTVFEDIDRQYLDHKKQVLRVGGRRELIQRANKSIDFDGTVAFSAMSSEEAVAQLQSRKIDVAISRIKPDIPNIIAKEFFSNSSWLVVHEKWAKGSSYKKLIDDRQFFIDTPAIAYSPSGEYLKEWLDTLGIVLKQIFIKFMCEDWFTIMHMVELGEGYAIIPDSIQSNLKSVIHIRLPENLMHTQRFYFLYNKSLRKLPAFKKLFV